MIILLQFQPFFAEIENIAYTLNGKDTLNTELILTCTELKSV